MLTLVQAVPGAYLQIQRRSRKNGAALDFGAQPDLVDAVRDAHLQLSRHIHDIEREQFARYPWEGYVQTDLHALASTLVDYQFWPYCHPPVVGPFSPRQPEDDQQAHYCDDTTRCGAHARIFDCLREGIEPCESRFRWHVGELPLQDS
jgi:hypothetical protein